MPRLPERVAAWIFRLIADFLWLRQGRSVRRLQSNYARVLGCAPDDPRVRRLGRAGVRSYMRYWMEALRLPAMSRERILAGTVAHGDEIMFKYLDRGQGAVMALPHMGNWDLAGAWLIARGQPFTTVAERLRPESLYRRYTAFREGLGMEVLPLTGGEGSVYGALVQRVRRGGVVCLPAERDLTASGVEVEFFGARTKVPAGPPLLAVQTGAVLLPAALWFEGEDWGIKIYEEIRVPQEGTRQEKITAVAQSLVSVFEKGIAEHPQDWHMLQRLWLDDPESGQVETS